MKALVTGGHGFVGSYVVRELLKRDIGVVCLVRPTSNTKCLDGLPIEFIEGDLRDIASLHKKIPNDIDYVFHIAGLISSSRADLFFETNQFGTLNLVNAVNQSNAKIKRFVYTSSIAASGPPSILRSKTEADPEEPVSIYGKSKLGGEKVLQKYAKDYPYTIIRPSIVYGPCDQGVFHFFKSIKLLGGIPISKPNERYYSLVHAQDLAEGILEAALSDKGINQTFNIVNQKFYSFQEIAGSIGKAMGKPSAKLFPIPETMISLGAWCVDHYTNITKKSLFLNTLKLPEIKATYWTFSADKAKKELGWENKISIHEGMKETTEWYKENKWL